jgi:hypothetical protein
MRILLSILLVTLLFGCSSETNEGKDTKNKVISHNQIQEKPSKVIINVNGKTQEAVLGSYSWDTSEKSIEVDSDSPTKLVDGKIPLSVTSDDVLKINFIPNRPAIELKIFQWIKNKRGQELRVSNDYSFKAPTKEGEYILEMEVRWPEGSAHYAAKIIVKN